MKFEVVLSVKMKRSIPMLNTHSNEKTVIKKSQNEITSFLVLKRLTRLTHKSQNHKKEEEGNLFTSSFL